MNHFGEPENKQIEKSLGRLPSSETPGKPCGSLVWFRGVASEANVSEFHMLEFDRCRLGRSTPTGFEILGELLFTDSNDHDR